MGWGIWAIEINVLKAMTNLESEARPDRLLGYPILFYIHFVYNNIVTACAISEQELLAPPIVQPRPLTSITINEREKQYARAPH